MIIYGDFRGAASMLEFMPRGVVGVAAEDNSAVKCFSSDTQQDCKGTTFGKTWVSSHGTNLKENLWAIKAETDVTISGGEDGVSFCIIGKLFSFRCRCFSFNFNLQDIFMTSTTHNIPFQIVYETIPWPLYVGSGGGFATYQGPQTADSGKTCHASDVGMCRE